MPINPTMLALSAANPGLLPLAFIGSGGSSVGGPGWLDKYPTWVFVTVITIYSVFALAIIGLAIAGAVVGTALSFMTLSWWFALPITIMAWLAVFAVAYLILALGYKF